ncbi:MAG: NAD(P)/FAD-dependent oxidoreductase [Zavarzinella sp.]
MKPNWDVVVVGAGAAGLMAAIRAAESGARTLLLEKNRKVGVKILMSGGTRCNITHNCTTREIVTAFGKNGNFLHSPLANFSVQDAIQFFHQEGVPTKVEDTGKIFPVSNKALDVANALEKRLQRAGAILALEEPLLQLQTVENGYELTTPKRTVTTAKVIMTTGGKSYPGCGTRGDGYPILTRFGHSIVPTQPALVPIRVLAEWIADLKGITLADVDLKVMEQQKKLSQRRNGFLFAHFGLSGPAPLDVSKAISTHERPASLHLECDFLPTWDRPKLDAHLQAISLSAGKKLLASVLSELLPRRLCDHFLQRIGEDVERKAAGLSKTTRGLLVDAIKQQHLPVVGTLGYEKAEVTTGGVALAEIDSRTMQSKLQSGLYVAGELLDLDGPIGGFNFQAAWSTGWLAGQSAARAVQEERNFE